MNHYNNSVLKLKKIIGNLINFGISDTLSEKKKTRVRVTNILSFATFLLVIPYYFLFQKIGADFLKILIPVVMLYQAIILVLNKKGYINASRFIAPNLNSLVIFIYSTSLGTETLFFLFYFPALTGSFLFYELKEKWFFSIQFIFTFLLIILDLFFKVKPFPFVNISSEDAVFSSYFLMIFAFVLYIVCIFALESETDKFEKRLNKNNQLLAESEKKFRNLITNIPDVVWTANNQGEYKYMSPNILSILGFSPDEICKKNNLWTDRIHSEDIKKVTEAFAFMFEKNEKYDVEYRIKRKDNVWIWIYDRSIKTYRENEVIYADGILSDITDSKLAEASLIKAKREAEAATAAKSDFLARMSHEIRTPMNAVIGLTHLVLGTKLSVKQSDYLKKIQGASQVLLGIINNVLDFSKIEAGKMLIEKTKFNLRLVLDNLSNTIGLKASEKGLKLLFELDERVPDWLEGDSLRLGQVLINLVDNAVKFTEEGSVVISTELIKANNDDISVLFSVRDTGIGMTEEQMSSLFERFTQVDGSITRRFGGTGLGLAISRQLVELMGSKLNVKSIFGKETVFSFIIDFKSIQEEDQVHVPIGSPTRLKGAKVLLVEDNPLNQQVIIELVVNLGLKYDLAVNGLEGFQMASNNSYDLILMDIQMPEMDGLTSAKKIRECGLKDLPIIAMTAHAMVSDKDRSLQAGMDDYLTKPIDPDELLRILLKHIKSDLNKKITETSAKQIVEDIDAKLPQIDGLDLITALHQLRGSKKLFIKLLGEFAKLYSGFAENIRSMVVNDDIENAKILSHSLKGASSTLGMHKISSIASDIEIKLLEGDTVYVLEYLSSNEDIISEIINRIDNYFNLNNYPMESVSKDKPKGSSMLSVPEQIRKFIGFCRNGDFESLEIAKQLHLRLSDTKHAYIMTDILDLVEDIEFNEATLLAGKLLKNIEG